uniref:Uncharacterized protein n=1 Tax=Glossina palpalis gambiensis TaxID=67801 RepID=A0A1B0C7C1_9MUSC
MSPKVDNSNTILIAHNKPGKQSVLTSVPQHICVNSKQQANERTNFCYVDKVYVFASILSIATPM